MPAGRPVRRNPYRIPFEDYAVVGLTDTHGKIQAVAVIDREDLDRVLDRGRWYRNPAGYAQCRDGTLMHRFITGCPKGLVVDHLNRRRLNNRKSNLRVCTPFENALNNPTAVGRRRQGGLRNVYWDEARQVWRVRFQVQGHRYYLDDCKTLAEAAAAAEDERSRIIGAFYLADPATVL